MSVKRNLNLLRYKVDYYNFLDDHKALTGHEYNGPQPTLFEAVKIIEILAGILQSPLDEFLMEIAEARQREIPRGERPRSRAHLLVAS